ncbi:hypothetical protein BSU04_00040 [Caballeronia sordidicola]|uniref:Uncharacterized protein n=1 Tax=Caballeronia sordidicola TaxID=196367 RepID=A0A226XB70_CABSO|nr:hypothetical protein BSU04_00040 [Caballeronia sordidicola]
MVFFHAGSAIWRGNASSGGSSARGHGVKPLSCQRRFGYCKY